MVTRRIAPRDPNGRRHCVMCGDFVPPKCVFCINCMEEGYREGARMRMARMRSRKGPRRPMLGSVTDFRPTHNRLTRVASVPPWDPEET